MNSISALIKETPESSLALPPCEPFYSEKIPAYEPGGGSLPKPNHAGVSTMVQWVKTPTVAAQVQLLDC